jgi:hypothetical protein
MDGAPNPRAIASLLDSINEELTSRHVESERTIAELHASLEDARIKTSSRREELLEEKVRSLTERVARAKRLATEQQAMLTDTFGVATARSLRSALRQWSTHNESTGLLRCFLQWVHFDSQSGLHGMPRQQQKEPKPAGALVAREAAAAEVATAVAEAAALRQQLDSTQAKLLQERAAHESLSARVELAALSRNLATAEEREKEAMALAEAARSAIPACAGSQDGDRGVDSAPAPGSAIASGQPAPAAMPAATLPPRATSVRDSVKPPSAAVLAQARAQAQVHAAAEREYAAMRRELLRLASTAAPHRAFTAAVDTTPLSNTCVSLRSRQAIPGRLISPAMRSASTMLLGRAH